MPRRVRFRCVDCKRLAYGSTGDEHRRSCERCGGQLKPLPYMRPKRRAAR